MKRFTLESIKPFSVLFISLILCAGEVWGIDVYTSNLDNTTLTGATASFSSCAVADAPAWGTGYTKGFLTSSSSGYATITFDPAIDLSIYEKDKDVTNIPVNDVNSIPVGWTVIEYDFDKMNPLLFNITSPGNIVWKTSDSSLAKTIEYSKDNGNT